MRDIANINDVDINNVRYGKVLFYVLLRPKIHALNIPVITVKDILGYLIFY